ncbi:helix-turn-helix domain-containing protein [Streptomyces sp. 058-1L]
MAGRHDMDELHGDRSSLAAQLRSMRMRRGLTLSALAERSSYSRSSWERYLNGKALPPQRRSPNSRRLSGCPRPPC